MILPITLCLAALLVCSPVAQAHPAGKTTLEETIGVGSGSGFRPLVIGKGEGFTVLGGINARARAGRGARRGSLVYFGQLTDPQLADEMSPARLEALDPAETFHTSAHRPQEALGPWLWDQTVRNVNRHRTSPVKQAGGKRARMGFVLATGDLADNHQLNETEWYVGIMEGGLVDPFSGKAISASNPCGQASAEQAAKINDDVANRRYTGIQDYDDWPADAPQQYKNGFWDPDVAPPAATSPYASFPRYPGLLDRAQRVFRAEGLKTPWFAVRGNHDGLVGGTIEGGVLFNAISTGCVKVFPNSDLPLERYEGDQGRRNVAADLSNGAFLSKQLAQAQRVPPDPDRRFVAASEYKRLHGRGDSGHGFAFVDRTELKRSGNAAAYYAMTRSGIRFIGIDTVAEGGGQQGNLDDPQYRWLERELKRAAARDQLTVVYGHHTLETMTNENPDEDAGACEKVDEPDCDLDTRKSTPLHLGVKGSKSLRNLLLRYRNVIAYVNGHTHANDVTAFKSGRRGFWSINTSAIADAPQQSRLIELMDNRDGTLSIFATLIHTAAPVENMASGKPANVFTDTQLGSLGRLIGFNDPQHRDFSGPLGTRRDRNVELLIDDPR